MDDKIILTYGIKPDRYKKFKDFSLKKGFRVLEVKTEESNNSVGNLLEGSKLSVDKDLLDIDIEFLLFANIKDDELYGFLGELKERDLYFPNKAVLTQTNINWTLRKLLIENKEEHIVMGIYSNLRRAIAVGNKLIQEGRGDKELNILLENGKNYLNPREFDFDELKLVYNSLAEKINILIGR